MLTKVIRLQLFKFNKRPAETIIAKYIFLDVVQFTKKPVEAQSDIIRKLNEIVIKTLRKNCIKTNNRIFIPTGDGICIVLKGDTPYDIDMIIALNILEEIENHNTTIKDEKRKFSIRIGINENTDNLIKDINGRINIAGAGINIANRIMNNADAGQILISRTVHERLYQRENYKGLFKDYIATIKHGITIPLYQYIKIGAIGLNINTPDVFLLKKDKILPYKLTKKVAYYFAHAIKNKDFLLSKISSVNPYAGVSMLWFLAEDSEEASCTKDFEERTFKQPGEGKLPIEKQFDYLNSLHFWIVCEFSTFIINNTLEKYYSDYFEDIRFGKCWFILNEKGQQKLKIEYPEIWKEFNFK